MTQISAAKSRCQEKKCAVRGSGKKARLDEQKGKLDEEIEKMYFLIGKAYEETGAAYLLIPFSYEQTAGAYKHKSPFQFPGRGFFA